MGVGGGGWGVGGGGGGGSRAASWVMESTGSLYFFSSINIEELKRGGKPSNVSIVQTVGPLVYFGVINNILTCD